MVAVLIDQSLAIALQEAFALQPLIKIMGVDRIAVGEGGIDNLDTASELNAKPCGGVAHALLAPDQQRSPEPLVHEGSSGADHLFFLALGEDDALRLPPQP